MDDGVERLIKAAKMHEASRRLDPADRAFAEKNLDEARQAILTRIEPSKPVQCDVGAKIVWLLDGADDAAHLAIAQTDGAEKHCTVGELRTALSAMQSDGLREALSTIASQAICYGMSADENELRDLLPCPFCGGKPHENRKTGLVRCDNPKCGVQTLALADHYWNTRTQPGDSQ